MPQTAKKFDMTAATYEGLCAPPPVLPTPGELFDYQVEGLVDRKLATYADADPFRNRLPEKGFFLFVPPPPKELDPNELMSRVALNGKTGVNYLDVQYLKDVGEYPATASLLTDVEDGRARLNVKPMVSRENIKREKRHPYNTWRGIIHVACMPWVLLHHCQDLVGSRCSDDYVPYLSLYDVKSALCNRWEGNANPKCGAPSSGNAIVP